VLSQSRTKEHRLAQKDGSHHAPNERDLMKKLALADNALDRWN
jgi:hypothetical protein